MPDPKRLTIDWEHLHSAFEDFPGEFGEFAEPAHYLDLQTGNVIFVNEGIRSTLQDIEEELEECLTEDDQVTMEAVENSDAFQQLPEWEKDIVRIAAEREYGDFNRYETIPHIESHESYRYMVDFIETVRDPAKQNRLADAIERRGPFRNFRRVLADDRRLERQWDEYKFRRQQETMLQWLRSIGVEPTNPQGLEFNREPLPDLRNIMFAEVQRFVRVARDLPGVERIALIGTLTTDKEFPPGIEVLVTVTDDCDLTELAKLGRQLAGHMLSQRAGAAVFLADPDGNCLGRTCPWRECGPGIRVRCAALHCGARHYLHDDLDAIQLKKSVIARPPAVLWPEPIANEDVPADVRTQLIEPLAVDDQR